MPLVQSLDILRQRVSNVTFKAVLDAIYERVKGDVAFGCVRRTRDAVPAGTPRR